VLGFGMRLHPRKKKHKQCISKVQVKHKQGTSESTSKTFFFLVHQKNNQEHQNARGAKQKKTQAKQQET
jgi:hypothetical protein